MAAPPALQIDASPQEHADVERRATSATDSMRIAYLLHTYPAISQAFVLREIRNLRRLGFTVDTFSVLRATSEHLLALADREEERSTVSLLPCDWRRLGRAHLAALRHPIAYARTLFRAIWDGGPGLKPRAKAAGAFAVAVVVWHEMRRRGSRHVHTHFAGTPTHVAWLASELGSAQDGAGEWSWSVTVHGPVEFYDVTAFRLGERLRQARFVAAISDFARSQIMALADPSEWSKVHIVRCAVDASEFEAVDRRGRPGTEILSVARLAPVKGQQFLLEAVAALRERGHPVHLTLVGEGDMRPALSQLAERLGVADSITFAGAVGQDDIRAFYADADIFCLSSFAEGLPVVLIEAMATQLPVVATRIAGIPELVEHEVNGLLVSPARADRLADAVERLVAGEELRLRLGQAGRDKVVAEYDPRVSAARLARLLRGQSPENGAAI